MMLPGFTNGRVGWRRAVTVLIVGAVLATSCTSDDGDEQSAPSTTSLQSATTGAGGGDRDPGPVTAGRSASGVLGLRLSEGEAEAAPAEPVAVVDGSPLDAAALAAIFDRLDDWVDEAALREDFRFPAQTLAPPRTGETVDVSFPPAPDANAPAGPATPPAGALEVLRYQPEGEVAVAPFVTITFSQPMVALGTLDQLDAATVPATITPDVPGRWQWIGTRTLRFDANVDADGQPLAGDDGAPVDRLAMATEFTVTVPAGTESASGATLADPVTFEFATPPVTVQSFQPEDSTLGLEPVFIAVFDQRVDAVAVLDHVVLRAGDDQYPVRVATRAEIEADDVARQIRGGLGALATDRWIAFRPVEPLPTDTAITVEIGEGTPSAEGPRTTTGSVTYRNRTYAPLRVVATECGFGPQCPPGTNLLVRFNNSIDVDQLDPETVRIEPALPGLFVNAYGDTIDIGGLTEARATYTITVPAGTVDIYGQVLAEDETETVEIGDAVPILHPFLQPLITLDPLAAGQTISVGSVGHDELRVQVFAVEPDEWDSYNRYLIESMSNPDRDTPVPQWPELLDTRLDTGDDPNRRSETVIDLAGALDGERGHVVVRVETTETYSPSSNEYWQNRPTMSWVQATAIGLDAFADNDELVVWATDLTTGAPIAGLDIDIVGQNQTVTTDAEGLAGLSTLGNGFGALVATRGDDVALLTPGFYGATWQGYATDDTAVWYVIDDRRVYRPGETVSVKGIARRLSSSGDAQLQLLDDDATVSYLVRDPKGNEIAKGDAELNPLGGFDFQLDVPVEANLGVAFVELTLTGVAGVPFAATQHVFEIQEFRRPEFEVVARHESPGPFVSTRPATVAADADYYAGGPLGAAPVDWRVTTADAVYSPPGWDEFTFGEFTPWWIASDAFGFEFNGGLDGPFAGDVVFDEGCCFPPFGESDVDVEVFSGTTDAAGAHYLQIDFVGPEGTLPDLPVTVTAEASVTDVNRQVLASRTSVLVHPGELYVGLRGTRTFVRAGDPLDVEAVVTDIDGAAVAGRELTLTAERLEWKFEGGEWSEQPVETQNCSVTSAAEPVSCSFPTTVGGTFTISSTIEDGVGGASRSELTRWVTGGDGRPSRAIEQESLTIVPDRAEYAPGETAELLVLAPFSGHGLATITRNGIDATQTFEVVDGSAIVEVSISDRQIPGLAISFEVVGTTPRTADDGTPLPDVAARPAFATGQISLPISTLSRTLTVTAVPRAAAVEPGSTTGVDVTVVDTAGAPVAGAEVAVMVVDEAVLALSGYELRDPLSVFYGQFSTYLQATYGRQSIVLVDPASLLGQAGAGADGDSAAAPSTSAAASETTSAERTAADASQAAPGPAAEQGLGATGEAGGPPGATPIGERTSFDALAVFEPSLTTDAAGTVGVDVPLPDSLTRYRVMVVAVAGADRFGSAEANITARLPLMVRPSAPRFANFGDRFELPVVVQNQTDETMEVDVALQTSNLTLDGPAGRRVSVPANDRVEVRFPVTTDRAGTARFRVAAVSGDAADATIVELPVYTPATAEVFATYGVLDGGATIQPLLAPTGVVPQFGGLEVTTSSTALQALTDAVLYISRYPYDSADARASRIMSIVALRDVLEAFDADDLPSPAELDAGVRADIAGLVALQNPDGGFPSWERNRRSEPYHSIQATHALVLARDSGFTVSDGALAGARGYLSDIENRIPSEYGQEARDTLSAYALHVRMLAGDRDTNKADALWDDRGQELPLDALAWLWPVIGDAATDEAIGRIFDNRAVETAGGANFTTAVSDDAYVILHSDRRTDGLALAALISERPASDLIPKVVSGLLGNQTRGRWNNIQENVFILLALKGYFDTFEAETPDFVARVWLGDTFAGEHTFAGRSTDRARISIPTTELIARGDTDIVVGREGTGRLYYRLGLRYAPEDLVLDPLDRGFVVERTYEAVDDPGDVTRDADGTWRITAGANVRVRLTMIAESQRTQVALVDPLPAGLEISNPALATTPEIPDDPALTNGDGIRPYCPWWCWPTWFEHQNLRDDRAEAFATVVPAGSYDYTYVARATTPGTFVVPPTRAEEIYAPETFGRAASDRVVIEA